MVSIPESPSPYSGYSGDEEVRPTREAGFAVHLTKPVDIDRVVEVIRSLVKR